MRVLLPERLTPHALAPSPGGAVLALDGATMGTSWSARLVPPSGLSAADARAGIAMVLDEVIARMSTWRADSDISRFNRAPAGSRHALPPDFAAVLAAGLDIAAQSGGAFDPAAGALVDLWGFGSTPAAVLPPADGAIAAARAVGDWRKLGWEAGSRVATQPGGLRLDLSGIAKGHAVDRMADWLAGQGVASYLVEVGGEFRGAGAKPDGQPWWVALEQPPGAGPVPPPTRIALHGLSVATSGDYRRYFAAGGCRYSHSIDPRTGWPIVNQLASVSVVHPSCMWADGWATALTVLGVEAGMALADRLGLAALFVRRDQGGFSELLTPALATMGEG